MIGSVTACKLWDTSTHLLCTCLGDPGNVDETAKDVCDIMHPLVNNIILEANHGNVGKEPGFCMIHAHTQHYRCILHLLTSIAGFSANVKLMSPY